METEAEPPLKKLHQVSVFIPVSWDVTLPTCGVSGQNDTSHCFVVSLDPSPSPFPESGLPWGDHGVRTHGTPVGSLNTRVKSLIGPKR